ncbi:helix-turn-helix transcriptional regulator [Mucilaginibacter auburnensis]|uniref:Putative DNA-binding transcriptional regulator YafY n=1 Tax=Mucilaginibacter auburnensis TaxID=1457233 RepID=A0A2H9VM87_9SPHI|nr:YafY family protein [Mucilaginibacter auburnensis]PJJ79436.1 putative DNA-binding transcriptional regulator YafY [Mucilaginibacter auburnensis]
MNRIDRISAILIQLQSRRVVKAADIAERFNISLRTVYRDVKTLEEAGIPLIGEAGVGYSIMDGYRLPPVMFTREEATAFLTAEKFVETLTDASTSSNYRSAMYKVRAVLKNNEKELLEGMDDRIEVLQGMARANVNPTDHIQTILQSIGQKKVLSLNYFAQHSQELTKRFVEPVGIFYSANYWHLIAWCRLRNSYRDFRVDRIKNLSITDEQFESEHPTLKEYIAKTACEQNLERVVISVDRKIHSHLEHQKYYSGFVSERTVGDSIEMTFLTTSVEGFARWYMMFGEYADILESENLKEYVKAKLEAIYIRINQDVQVV